MPTDSCQYFTIVPSVENT